MNKRTTLSLLGIGLLSIGLVGCSDSETEISASFDPVNMTSADQANWSPEKARLRKDALTPYPALGLEALPADLEWTTHPGTPYLGSSEAISGGTFYTNTTVYPLTLRTVGPDSNNSFRSYLGANQWSLTTLHPNTETPIPQLAREWAVSADQTTLYYRLNPNVRWSDGIPVTADDFLFTLEFMRSEEILAPWYNNYFTEQIVDIRKYDDYTIAVVGNVAKPEVDLHTSLSIGPKPRHFHVLDADWIQNANWAIEPNTGPYQIDQRSIVEGKGDYVSFTRKQDWWGDDDPMYQGRFNVDRVRIKVIRDPNLAFKSFLKGDLDTYPLVLPSFWHEQATGEQFDRGYIEKLVVYNDTRQPSTGMWMNQAVSPLDEQPVRLGIQHALNYDKMIATVLRNDYVRLPQHYTGYGEYSNPDISPRPFDLDQAASYFREAGFTERGPDGILVRDGQRLAFNVTYSQAIHTPRLVVLKEEAKKAGLELNLQLLDGQNAFKNVIEKQHQIAWMGWSTGFRPAYWEHYHSANADQPQTNNITNMKRADLDVKIEAYRSATTAETRIALSHEIQAILHDQAVFAPAYMVPYFRGAHWRWIRLPEAAGSKDGGGIYDPFTAASGGLFWIDPERAQETRDAQDAGRSFEPVLEIDERFKP